MPDREGRARAQTPVVSVARSFGRLLVFLGAACAVVASSPRAWADDDEIWLARRRESHAREALAARGQRDITDLLHDEDRSATPFAEGSAEGASALAIVDGDETTAWRGDPSRDRWSITMPFTRGVHLSLLRVRFGDNAAEGVPLAYRWQIQPPVAGRCEPSAPFVTLRDGRRDDRQGNPFLHGSEQIHAVRQAVFADEDACALRLSIDAMGPSAGPPVVREIRALEGARSIAEEASAFASGKGRSALLASSERGLLDGRYETLWAGEAGHGPWTVELTFPAPRLIDRVALTLGLDAVTVPDDDGRGRSYVGAYLPVRYRVETSHDDDPAHFVSFDTAPALPLRRRLLVDRGGRPVKRLRIVIDEATGPWGERDAALGAPVIRDLSVYAADDLRPVVKQPAFLVVDANPALLTHEMKGGEAFSDGLHARDVHARLRRILGGVDADTRWPADASRARTVAGGRFVEVIEGDDPTLSPALLTQSSPPPTLVLSGAFDWEFDAETKRTSYKPGRVHWNVVAPPGDDGGMGGLAPAVQARLAPMIGFCGGAQILALLTSMSERAEDVNEAEAFGILDGVLLRNDNTPIRGRLDHPDPYERTFWFDPPSLDGKRPTLVFDPRDPLFAGFSSPDAPIRRETREIASSHGDMLRASAFERGPLVGFDLAATSTFCRTWVMPEGPERTTEDPARPDVRCVTVPQAFRSRGEGRFPIIGFQFHPEQRDLQRLAPGSAPEARGDALNVLANAVDLALEGYVRGYWGQRLAAAFGQIPKTNTKERRDEGDRRYLPASFAPSFLRVCFRRRRTLFEA